MVNLLNYFVYAAVFIGVVLAMEGLWLLIRAATGEGPAVNRRLARIRKAATAGVQAAEAQSPVDAWLDKRLPALGRNLVRARASVAPKTVVAAGFVIAALVLAGLTLSGVPAPLALLSGVVAGIGLPTLFVSVAAGRRQKRFLNQLPQAVELIARSLQAGHPVTQAMTVVSKQMPDPIGPEFGVVIEEMTYGLERDAALSALVGRFPSPEMRMFVASLEVTRESGGNLAEVFLKLADAIRAKAQLRLKVEALSAEGRLSFWVVSSLPIAVGGVLMFIRPTYYSDVANDPLFWPMMVMSPVMLAIGATMIWRMVNFKI